MEKTIVDRNIKQFISRISENFLIEKMSNIDPEKLLTFNMNVYEGEFNATRFADRNKIKKIWKWKYEDNPASKSIENFGWLADYKGFFIGQFRFMPADIKIGDRYYRSAWGADLAILKKYRNIGISSFLIQHARKEIGKDFALFLLGGMNENSYNIFKKSGFINIGKISRYVKILDLNAILACYSVPHFLPLIIQSIFFIVSKILSPKKKNYNNAATTAMVDSFNDEFNEFWNSVSAYYKCIAKRDADFLKWRYIDQPLWSYTILKVARGGLIKGFAVLRESDIKNGRLKSKKIGIISDILIDPEDDESAHRLLAAITDFFRNKKVLFIKCDIINNYVERALISDGFMRMKPKYSFMLNVYENNISRDDINLAASRKNWFVSWGDSDLDFD